MVWFRLGYTTSCGWNVRCVGVRGSAWPVLLSPCNTDIGTKARLDPGRHSTEYTREQLHHNSNKCGLNMWRSSGSCAREFGRIRVAYRWMGFLASACACDSPCIYFIRSLVCNISNNNKNFCSKCFFTSTPDHNRKPQLADIILGKWPELTNAQAVDQTLTDAA